MWIIRKLSFFLPNPEPLIGDDLINFNILTQQLMIIVNIQIKSIIMITNSIKSSPCCLRIHLQTF